MTNCTHRVSARRGQEGTALIAVLVIMSILAAGSTTTLHLLHMRNDHAQKLYRTQQARHIAEGGIDAAIAKLRLNSRFTGEVSIPLGWGRYSTQVKTLTNTQDESIYTIAATGQLAEGNIVQAEMRLVAHLTLDTSRHIREYTLEEVRP